MTNLLKSAVLTLVLTLWFILFFARSKYNEEQEFHKGQIEWRDSVIVNQELAIAGRDSLLRKQLIFINQIAASFNTSNISSLSVTSLR